MDSLDVAFFSKELIIINVNFCINDCENRTKFNRLMRQSVNNPTLA